MIQILGTIAAISLPLLASSASLAGSMPPDIAEKLAAIGRVIAPPPVNAIYAPLHKQEPFAGIKINRDVKYGPAERNRLDVFTPEAAGGGARPVLLYVHGGGFVRGDKHTPNSPFLDNIAVWAVNNGMIGINLTYRLAPQSTWPSGPQDMAAAINWVRANVASQGGDPSRIYLMGSSAGAGHVADYIAFPEYHATPGSGLAGAILLSGSPFDPTVFDNMKEYASYFGEDASKYPSLSPTPGLLKSPTPLMVVWAGLDPPGIEKESINLNDALCKAQKCPTKVFLKTHDHISVANAIGTDDTELSDQILAFVKAGKPTN